jgi:AcrR family transcriptional regulator
MHTDRPAPLAAPKASAKTPNKTQARREAQLEALIDAAEVRINREGVAGLKMRDLAADIGVALGGLYNIVEDMDELILRITDRTLRRLDGQLAKLGRDHQPPTPQTAVAALEATAIAYLDFAQTNLSLWRALFEMRLSKPELPEFNIRAQLGLFEHIAPPIRVLMPDADEAARALVARTLFAAVHGIVLFGLEDRLIAVPREALKGQLSWLLRSIFSAA